MLKKVSRADPLWSSTTTSTQLHAAHRAPQGEVGLAISLDEFASLLDRRLGLFSLVTQRQVAHKVADGPESQCREAVPAAGGNRGDIGKRRRDRER
jgi:hypothetical protein